MDRKPEITMLKTAAIVLCGLVLIRHAWICDDAFITLRTVRNLLDGEGPRWNLHERVQSYTHPLWMLLLSVFFAPARDPVAATLLPSLCLSLGTLYIIAFRMGLPAPAALLALASLISSKSFVDYSTSGLENPLTHFLFALLAAELFRGDCSNVWPRARSRRTALRMTVLMALIGLNRPDAMLVGLPLLLSAYRRPNVSLLWLGKTTVMGLAPLLVWEAFAIIYYGFPFPNTAYAKLANQIPFSDLWLQGGYYYLSQLAFDPLSLFVIACALVSVVLRRDRQLYPVGLGLVLYLLYIIYMGGDFMAGRFFSLPLMAASILLARVFSDRLEVARPASHLPSAVVVAAGLILTPHPTMSMNVDYELKKNPVSNELWDERGVCDERAYYSVSSALFRMNRYSSLPNNWHKARGQGVAATAVESMAQVGVAGFFAPRTAIIVDTYSLTDAFLARLPAAHKVDWRPGHYAREIPPGYIESLKQGRNLITKRNSAWLYDQVKLVVSGPIWSWERWKEIVRLNLGLSLPDTMVWDTPWKNPPKSHPRPGRAG